MRVVSNTSPLLNLAIIDRLDLLPRQFGEVRIPPAVLDELKPNSELQGAARIGQAVNSGWLKVVELADDKVARVLMRELGHGESEAIALALQINSTMILMDEHEGREVAKAVGLRPIGILGVRLREKNVGGLRSVAEVMDELSEKAGFFIAPALYDKIMRAGGGS